MADYAFYKIVLFKPQQTRVDSEHDIPLEHAQEWFGRLFERKCSLDNTCMIDGNGGVTKLDNRVLENRGDIIIWRIHNEQPKEIWKPNGRNTNGIPDYEAVNEISRPHSYVIIDNRPGKLFMAIEKSTTWRSSTNRVRDLVGYSLSEMLKSKFNLDIRIIEQTIPTKIWDFCEARCKNGKDAIKKISFNIKNPAHYAPTNRFDDKSLPDVLKSALAFNKLTGALSSTFSANYHNASTQQLRSKVDDFVNLMRTCTQNEYELELTFVEYGVYKCDEQVVAVYPLRDGDIKNFLTVENGNIFESNPMASWFDKNIEDLDNIRNANKAPAPICR